MKKPPIFPLSNEQTMLGGYKIEPLTIYKPIPVCSFFHLEVFRDALIWFEEFPKCCPDHTKMMKLFNLKKSDFEGTPQRIIKNLLYTEHLISYCIEKEEWKKIITDYFTFSFFSYGNPEVGCEKYKAYLKGYIKHVSTDIPEEKKVELIDFLESNSLNTGEKGASSNFVRLIDLFYKWLNSVPNLSLFSKYKEHFSGSIPFKFFAATWNKNIFSKRIEFTLLSEEEICEKLIESTKKLLLLIDTPEMIRKGILKDNNKYEFDLISENHRMKQLKLLSDFSTQEIEYINIFQSWLTNEKNYFKDLARLMPIENETPTDAESLNKKENVEQQETTEQMEKSDLEIAYDCIEFLGGHWHDKTKIMEDNDFQRLKFYVKELVEKKQLPSKLEKIVINSVPKKHITYTFYLIHLRLYGKYPKLLYFIDFLRAVFPTLKTASMKTMKTGFSKKPDSYEKDIQSVLSK